MTEPYNSAHFFYTLRGIRFLLSNHTYFLILSLSVAAKLEFLGFQRELNKFLWSLKHSLKNKVCSCKRLFPLPFFCDVMMHIISLSFSNIYELLIVLLFKAWYFLYDCYNVFLECQYICIWTIIFLKTKQHLHL